MVILDGCCGAGGAARGYVLAGHEVWGADSAPQPNYLKSGAAGFLQCDILDALSAPWTAKVDFIHVSPPCQFYSAMAHARPGLAERYPDLIGPVRELLNATGRPWVIENVAAARPWMKDPALLCAQMFRPGIPLYRHRLFEAGGGFTLAAPPEPSEGMPGRRRECGWPHPVPASRAGHWRPGTAISVAGHVGNVALARKVMEIGWTTREELAEAIPPYYTRWVGHQLAAWAARKGDPDGGVMDDHPRVALNIASLALGWDRWLWYAEAAGAITVGEREQLWPRVWKALCDLGAEQARCQLAADPASTYLRALSALVTSGRAYLAAHDGGQPAEPQRYGWQFHGRSGLDPGVTFDTERERYGTWEPQGALIGWVTEDGVFLDPAVAYRAARQFAEQAGTPLGVSDYALRQQLRDRRLLASTGGTGSVTVQRRLGGRVRSVLHLSAASFDGDAG